MSVTVGFRRGKERRCSNGGKQKTKKRFEKLNEEDQLMQIEKALPLVGEIKYKRRRKVF